MLTVGHGAAREQDFGDRLVAAGVGLLVDVRTAPGSRRHPYFGRDVLQRWLPERGMDYRWEPRLGGFRRPATDSPDIALPNHAFRGYAGHMRTPEFRAAVADCSPTLRLGGRRSCAARASGGAATAGSSPITWCSFMDSRSAT